MDMKFGIALDVEIMHQIESKLIISREISYYCQFLTKKTIPQECWSSVELLTRLKEERKLEYVCCIVSEPHFRNILETTANTCIQGLLENYFRSFTA